MVDVQKEIFRRMPPFKKLDAAAALRASAMEWKAAWIRQKHPEWSEEKIWAETKKVFLYARS